VVSKAVCKSKTAVIDCGNRTITIHQALYGRTRATCGIYRVTSFGCVNDVTDDIVELCHLRSSCIFDVTDSLFGDPCNGYSEFLDLKYSCTNTKPSKITGSLGLDYLSLNFLNNMK